LNVPIDYRQLVNYNSDAKPVKHYIAYLQSTERTNILPLTLLSHLNVVLRDVLSLAAVVEREPNIYRTQKLAFFSNFIILLSSSKFLSRN